MTRRDHQKITRAIRLPFVLMSSLPLALRKLLQWLASTMAPLLHSLPKTLRFGVPGQIASKAVELRARSLASSADRLLEEGDVKGAFAQVQECLALVPDTDDLEPFRMIQLLPRLAVIE